MLILCSFIVLLCEVDLSPFATSITGKEQITKKLPYSPIQKEMISYLLFINFLKMPPRGVETIINHSNNGREISSQCEHIIYKGLDSDFRLAPNATQSLPSAEPPLHPQQVSYLTLPPAHSLDTPTASRTFRGLPFVIRLFYPTSASWLQIHLLPASPSPPSEK